MYYITLYYAHAPKCPHMHNRHYVNMVREARGKGNTN